MSTVDDRCGTLGYKIGQLRMEEGYNYAAYAKVSGISTNRLRSLERGKDIGFKVHELLRIGRFHGVSMDELLVEECPLPDRFARTAERLRTNESDNYVASLHVSGRCCALETIGIDEAEYRHWGLFNRADQFREKGLIRISG